MRGKQGAAACLLALCLLLSGCAPLLERTYSTVEPHSSKFWESEAAGTLRAENRQDIVNDLLLLIGQHTETAALRLYNFADDLTVADTLEQATTELQQETPMGAYAVEYITASSQRQRGYYEIAVQIGYRRTLEQIQAVVNATSPEALYTLLDTALEDGRTELAVRLGYWGADGGEQVQAAMDQLRLERGLEDAPPWMVNYYPSPDNVGLIEFLLDPPEMPEEPPEILPAENGPPPEPGEVLPGEEGAEAPPETETEAETKDEENPPEDAGEDEEAPEEPSENFGENFEEAP